MATKAPTYTMMPPTECAGFWVYVKLGEEDPQWSKCTSTKDLDGLFVSMRLVHPSCGHCSYERPKTREIAVRLLPSQKPEPIVLATDELW
jgi:hypothetical protein